MSNKLKKTITCSFCDKTVKYTNDCQKLFDRDVCPDCASTIVRLVNKMMVDGDQNKED